jgi:hypothetical protein
MVGLQKAFWGLALIALPLFAGTMIWTFASSGYYLRVLDMQYDAQSETITMTREVLSSDDVLARWHMSVQVTGTQRECSDSGVDIYEPRYIDGTQKRIVTFAAGRLAPCLASADHQIVASWQVLMWGVLPLKPTFYFKPPRT